MYGGKLATLVLDVAVKRRDRRVNQLRHDGPPIALGAWYEQLIGPTAEWPLV
jgi:hypothetical protein